MQRCVFHSHCAATEIFILVLCFQIVQLVIAIGGLLVWILSYKLAWPWCSCSQQPPIVCTANKYCMQLQLGLSFLRVHIWEFCFDWCIRNILCVLFYSLFFQKSNHVNRLVGLTLENDLASLFSSHGRWPKVHPDGVCQRRIKFTRHIRYPSTVPPRGNDGQLFNIVETVTVMSKLVRRSLCGAASRIRSR